MVKMVPRVLKDEQELFKQSGHLRQGARKEVTRHEAVLLTMGNKQNVKTRGGFVFLFLKKIKTNKKPTRLAVYGLYWKEARLEAEKSFQTLLQLSKQKMTKL